MQTQINKLDKIFIVDDDELTSNVYGQHLNRLGFDDVHIFNDGLYCLNALIDEPTIIFLDHQMDNVNGMEVLQKVKRFNPNIYVVFVSGQEDISTAVDALKHGAFDYIIKGANDLTAISEVLTKINNVNMMLTKREPGLIGRIISLIV